MREKTERNSRIIDKTGTYLTYLSANYLDWFNIGGLARHRTRETIAGLWTHYSWRELFIRGGMLTTTILLAAYGGQPENPEDNFSLGNALLYGTAGFFVTHGVAVFPTVHRRHQIVKQTNQLVDEIIIKLDHIKQNNTLAADLIFDKVNLIQQFNFSALKRGDAAVNLIKKKCLMQKICSILTDFIESESEDFDAIFKFWNQDIEILIDNLTQDITIFNPDRLTSTNGI